MYQKTICHRARNGLMEKDITSYTQGKLLDPQSWDERQQHNKIGSIRFDGSTHPALGLLPSRPPTWLRGLLGGWHVSLLAARVNIVAAHRMGWVACSIVVRCAGMINSGGKKKQRSPRSIKKSKAKQGKFRSVLAVRDLGDACGKKVQLST